MAERAHPEDGGFREGSAYYHQFVQRHTLARHHIAPHHLVLDIPCGVGWGTSLLPGKYVHGIDKSSAAIDYAVRRYANDRLSFAIGDMADPCWAKSSPFGKADCVICLEGIEHIHKTEANIFLTGVYEALRPGGKIVISTPERQLSGLQLRITNPYHLHEYEMGELYTLMLKHGFQVTDSSHNPGVEGYILFIVGEKL